MKSKQFLTVGVLTGVIALSLPVHAGPLGIGGIGTGAVGIGGASSGSINSAFGAAALNGSHASFGAAGSAWAMTHGAANASSIGIIGAGASGNVTGNVNSAVSANPAAITSTGQGVLHSGSRAPGRAEGSVNAVKSATQSRVDAAQSAGFSAHEAAQGTVHTPDPGGDITTQTRQVLERIDALLAMAGTDKSKLLTAQVWLSDMRLFEAHNVAWNAWVDHENPPVRACVRADLVRPGLLVEIMVTAGR